MEKSRPSLAHAPPHARPSWVSRGDFPATKNLELSEQTLYLQTQGGESKPLAVRTGQEPVGNTPELQTQFSLKP